MRTALTPVFILIFLFTGCKQIIMMRYGIHKPREETPESIQKFLENHKFPSENIFMFRDSSAFFHYLRDSVYSHHLLGTLFYSTHGLLDNFNDTSQGQWSDRYQIKRLKKDTIFHADTTHTFAGLMRAVVPLSMDTKIDTSRADYVIVATWATFIGNYNKRLFFITTAIREQKEVTVIPVFLNTDMQKEWNLTHDQRLTFRDD